MLATMQFKIFCLPIFSKKKKIKIKIYKIIILSETLFLTLIEVLRLRVFESKEPRRIFGPKREEVVGGWRRLHNEELHNLYTLQNIIREIKSRRMRGAGHVACMG
jgi:hypothetical protein